MLALALTLALAPPQDGHVGEEIAGGRRARKPPLVEVDDTGLALPSVWHAAGRYVAFAVIEANQGGTDLNGDGDALDRVLFVLDVLTGEVTNLGVDHFDGFGDEGMLVDGQLAYRVFESELGTDVNGDGYLGDLVPFVFEAGTGVVHSTDVLGKVFVNGGERALLRVSEQTAGVDLNGDGDTADSILHDWNLETGEVRNLNYEAASSIIPWTDSFLFLRPERLLHDYNGDADADDQVLYVYEGDGSTILNTGLALGAPPVAAADLAALVVDERAQGNTDLNGDGDAADQVLFVHDRTSGEVRNLGAAVRRPTFNLLYDVVESVAVRVTADRVAYVVSELDQGATDLNGDGDALDLVLFAHTFSTNETVALGAATFHYALDEDLLAFQVDEESQGANLNGDNNQADFVLFVHDFRTGQTTNTGLAVSQFSPGDLVFPVAPAGVAFTVNERAQRADLNGDGDRDDDVVHFFDAGSGAVENLGRSGSLGSSSDPMAWFGARAFYFSAWEDLDGDGDPELRILALDTRSGRLLDTGLADVLASEPFGSHMALLSYEIYSGTDLNGDGDATDTVIRSARIRP